MASLPGNNALHLPISEEGLSLLSAGKGSTSQTKARGAIGLIVRAMYLRGRFANLPARSRLDRDFWSAA
jgi:hypothetical protein